MEKMVMSWKYWACLVLTGAAVAAWKVGKGLFQDFAEE